MKFEYALQIALAVVAAALSTQSHAIEVRRANLTRGANLRGADYHGADLTGATITRSYLGLANFAGANLRQTRWYKNDLKGVNLRGADLRGSVFILCDLQGAVYSATTRLPFTEEAARAKGMIREN